MNNLALKRPTHYHHHYHHHHKQSTIDYYLKNFQFQTKQSTTL